MEADDRIVLLYGDIGNNLFNSIRTKFPSRAVNCGVAEANMVSISAGMSSVGLVPVVYTISSFLYLKALEQIKLDISYPNRPVVLVGTGGGFSYAGLGTTHHSVEDFAILGSLPNMSIFSPADNEECSSVFRAALNSKGPAWIRLGKKEQPIVHKRPLRHADSSGVDPILVYRSNGYCKDEGPKLLSTGLVVSEAREAALKLEDEGILTEVWSIPQLKPFPAKALAEVLAGASVVFTIEEHVPVGGLASVISACLPPGGSVRLLSVSSGDNFHPGTGTTESARAMAQLDAEGIVRQVKSFLARA